MNDLSHVQQKHVVLYHGNCPDGFTAAWVFWKMLGDTAHYEPVYYGPETRPPTGLQGKHVYVVDFGFDDIEDMRALAAENDVTWIDHHVTQEATAQELAREGNIEVIFNTKYSGARLTWNYAVGNAEAAAGDPMPVPWIILYVEDRDLWNWRLRESHEVSAFIQSQPMTFEAWSEMAAIEVDDVIEYGRVASRLIDQYADRVVNSGWKIELIGYSCFVVNATYQFVSDALNMALKTHSDVDVALSYHAKGTPGVDGCVTHSLRSRKGSGVDVSKIAAHYGGGGHENAAGFEVKESLPELRR